MKDLSESVNHKRASDDDPGDNSSKRPKADDPTEPTRLAPPAPSSMTTPSSRSSLPAVPAQPPLGSTIFSPFRFIQPDSGHLFDLKTILKRRIKLPSPPDVPIWSTPLIKPKKCGIVLGQSNVEGVWLKQVQSSAFFVVRLDGTRYIANMSGDQVPPQGILLDPMYEVETNVLCLMLDTLKEYYTACSVEYKSFSKRLMAWRADWREWEVEVLELLKNEGVSTIDDRSLASFRAGLERKKTWDEDYEARCGFSGRNFMISPKRSSQRTGPYCIKDDDVLKLFNDLKLIIHLIETEIAAAHNQGETERLLATFAPEESEVPRGWLPHNDPIGAVVKRQGYEITTFPRPGPDAVRKFHNWCVERHASWSRAREKKSTYHEVYLLADETALRNSNVEDWPRGNHGLILEFVDGAFRNDALTYCWGLPAFKLYEAMKEEGIHHRYFNLPVRQFLLDLEIWYFAQQDDRLELLPFAEIVNWPLDNALTERLREILKPNGS
ncbi:hypothetical protein BJX64DRAFT_284859 [Aspergillus heterothallicus]